MKILSFFTIFFLLLLSVSPAAGDISVSQAANQLSDFTVLPDNYQAAIQAVYTLDFKIPKNDFLEIEFGGLVFTFPSGFDVSGAMAESLSHTSVVSDYKIRYTQIDGRNITVTFDRTFYSPNEIDDSLITVTLTLTGIVNPFVSGKYQIVGLAFGEGGVVLAGPSLSDEFGITQGPVIALDVLPSGDLELDAGDVVTFSVVGRDLYGNEVANLVVDWMLADSSENIGEFVGSSFRAITVGEGRVKAVLNTISGISGLIIVTPGSLARLDLEISDKQIVGAPLLSSSYLRLFDGFNNPKTDYDLNTNQIHLMIDKGQLNNSIINNQGLLQNGVIDLSQADISYEGSSAITNIYASSPEGINSNTVTVPFSGYNIRNVLDANDNPITAVYTDLATEINVVVVNYGTIVPSSNPDITLSFEKGTGTVSGNFAPSANGIVDTISLILLSAESTLENDILIINLDALFSVESQMYPTIDADSIPVDIQRPAETMLIPGSFAPDTVYPGEAFNISFQIQTSGLVLLGDQADLKISFNSENADDYVVFQGKVKPATISGDIISFRNIAGIADTASELTPGWYQIVMDYFMLSTENVIVLNEIVDSVLLLGEIKLAYAPNSLGPGSVYAAGPASFGYTINLIGDYAVPVKFDNSNFTVTGKNFTASSKLKIGNFQLKPGANLVETEPIMIPLDQVGVELKLSTNFSFSIPGTQTVISFENDFNGESIRVSEPPDAQIIDLEIVSPNAPAVNTNQQFQARCYLANLTENIIGPMNLSFSSDGESVFELTKTIDPIDPNDTIEIYFDIIAAANATDAEIFRVEISSPHIIVKPPVNNLALVKIEAPAALNLSHTLSKVDQGLIDQNQAFSLRVNLENVGDASVSSGRYLLTTGGVGFGYNDSLTGTIATGDPLEFDFVSPLFDTTVTFEFFLTSTPKDLNIDAPAQISDTSFSFELTVENIDANIIASASLVGSNLVQPGGDKELFRMILRNTGSSSASIVGITEFSLALRYGDIPLDPAEVFNLSHSYFTLNGAFLASELSGGDRMSAEFNNLTIDPQKTCTLLFVTEISSQLSHTFTLVLESDDIAVEYVTGPNEGVAVSVSSSTGEQLLLSQTFVTKGIGFQKSFVIRDNPVNPFETTAEFTYELNEESPVEFRVFTLTGEEVYAWDIPIGGEGSSIGEHMIEWNGENNKGHQVLNGVYIVMITAVNSGEQARLKVAVIK